MRWEAIFEQTGRRFSEKWDAIFLKFFVREKNFEEKYKLLFKYFFTGFLTYVSRWGSRVYYPGRPSCYGALVDGLEGFSRNLPLLAVWIASGRDPKIFALDGRQKDLRDIIGKGIRNGVTLGRGSWGAAEHYSQSIVEAHDIALSVWLLKEHWDSLFIREDQRNLVQWLENAAQKKHIDNNWHLFPCIVDGVLLALGWGGDFDRLKRHFSRIEDFYLKCGWFMDGPGGKVDFYNAWGFHYGLFWLQQILPDFKKVFISEAQKSFFSTYQYLITPNGVPLMGRSLIYRLAVSVPYLIAAHQGIASHGVAKRAFDATWTYYVEHGALSKGRMTQGIFCDNPAILDNYSGPGSPLWGLRSFILALFFKPKDDFWMCSAEPLPIEKGDFEITIPEIGWTMKGEHMKDNEALIIKAEGRDPEVANFNNYTIKHYLREKITAIAARPDNLAVKYCLKRYSSCKNFQDRVFRNKT